VCVEIAESEYVGTLSAHYSSLEFISGAPNYIGQSHTLAAVRNKPDQYLLPNS